MNFEFVDRIYDFEKNNYITGSKLISLEEFFLQRPLGLKKSFPGLLMIESMFQLGNWLVFLSSDYKKMGFIVMFNKMEMFRNPSAGDKLLMKVTIERMQKDSMIMNGVAYIDNELVFKGTRCMLHLDNLDEYYRKENLKVKFTELYRENKGILTNV